MESGDGARCEAFVVISLLKVFIVKAYSIALCLHSARGGLESVVILRHRASC